MSMAAESSIANLPLNDPLCANDTCLAYQTAQTASQAQISWASQFEYAKWTTYYYCLWIFIFALVYWCRGLGSLVSASQGQVRWRPRTTTLEQKIVAVARRISYRRAGEGRSLGSRRRRWAGYVFGWSGMSVGVALFLILGILFVAITTFAQRPYYRLRRGFGSPPLAVRSGMMALALTPVIVALSGKYNIVTLLTGISHERLNVLHRWVSYICLVLSIVHTVPFIVAPLRDGGRAMLREQFAFAASGASEYTGIPPFAVLVFLAAFSIPWIRRRFYEIFVHSHIAAAIAYLGLMFWHTSKALDSWDYLWATVAVWLCSLLGRLAVKVKTYGLQGAETRIEDLDGEMLKLTIPPDPETTWAPGQHVFLRFPEIAPLDNHPFTIASVCSAGSTKRDAAKGGAVTPLKFLVRPYNGITKSLMHHAHTKGPAATLKAFVDGPYGGVGERPDLGYEGVILVAGGGGVTAVLPWLTYLSRRLGTGGCVTREVRLIWAVKHRSALSWIEDEVKEALETAPAGSIGVEYYVTAEVPVEDSSGTTRMIRTIEENAVDRGMDDLELAHGMIGGEKNVDEHTRLYDAGSVLVGRPNLAVLIPKTVRCERTCVIGCGPASMTADLSNAVAACQKKVLGSSNDDDGDGVQEISLHTERFEW
ncbi:MAG: hypothetical protein M1819_006196 [Sarea resinae]|nr:MAG: hypothetical protein M1819_006196 [Sarea resinae]